MDQLINGDRLHAINATASELVDKLVPLSMSCVKVAGFLSKLGIIRSLPAGTFEGNDTEFTSKVRFEWAEDARITLPLNQLGKPT